MSQALRNLALAILDDEHGINSQAWETLADMLDDDGQSDIVEAVRATEGRFYLTKEASATLATRIAD